MIYFCNDDEDFVVGIYAVDRDDLDIARILGKNIEMDLVECESEQYSDFDQSTFSHDTIIIQWSQVEAYSDMLGAMASKKINLYIVF
jgi:hypothetical protein